MDPSSHFHSRRLWRLAFRMKALSAKKKLPRPKLAGFVEKLKWNQDDKSEDVVIFPGGRLAYFHPNWANGTAGIRGNKPINRQRAKCYWEIRVKDRVFGTSMMFGVTTRQASLHDASFTNLIGEDKYGWGLSHKGLLWHNGKWKVYTKPFRENCTTVIGCLYDGSTGTLTFYKDGVSLGVAFSGLHRLAEPLYPTVSSTAAKTEFTFLYAKREYANLQERCRTVIRRQLSSERAIRSLPLPGRLLSFLQMKSEEEDIFNSSTEDLPTPPPTPAAAVNTSPVLDIQMSSPVKSNFQPTATIISLAQLTNGCGFRSHKIPMPDL